MVRSRGHLTPGSPGVTLSRLPIGLDDLVRWAWVVRWDLPAGHVSRQRVLQYPAFNLVTYPDGTWLHGPATVVDVRELTGRSWVVGLLLRPAAAPLLTSTPAAELRGTSEEVTAPSFSGVVADLDSHTGDHAIVEALRDRLGPLAARVTDVGRLVNRACALAEERTDLTRAADLADAVGIAPRTLERLVRAHIGLTPLWLIECRRLQYAATTLREAPATGLADLAAELGYADQAHFTRRYREVVGETPGATRAAARDPGPGNRTNR
ncbi:AraC family transcriptional regulator [Pseudonocardia phyllosphaerae]|uniref:AraC family transcriptional regulator n=1 Tax=Pseudonocardia phyllosphaerae TaxID=3390502 RepID=UPI003979EB11